MSLRIAIALLCAAFWVPALPQSAAAYPDQPVRIVVPFPAGGTNDLLARQLSFHLEASLKQPFIVDNRAGSGGNAGTLAVARSEPDGYTMVLTSINYSVSPALYRKLPYDPMSDLAPVTQLTESVLVLVSSADLPRASVGEIVALAKSKPGVLNYGSTGPGSVLQLTMELFKIKTGTNIVEVPYRGDSAVIQALIRNDVQLAVTPLTVALPHIESGRIHAIAVAGGKRTPLLPDIKTIQESGVANFDISGWHAFLMPARTDTKKINLIQQETAKALATPQMKLFLAQNALVGVGGTPAELWQKVQADMALFAGIIRDAKIKQVE